MYLPNFFFSICLRLKPGGTSSSSSSSSNVAVHGSGAGCDAGSLGVSTDHLLPDEAEEELELARAEGPGFGTSNTLAADTSTPVSCSSDNGSTLCLHEDHCTSLLNAWGSQFAKVASSMLWAMNCQTKAVEHDTISLVELTESCGDDVAETLEGGLEQPSSISYKLIYWDLALSKGRWLNDLDTTSQRSGSLLYMPKVLSRNVAALFSEAGESRAGVPLRTCKVLLGKLPIDMVRPKYLRPELPVELKQYLGVLDSLRVDQCVVSDLWQQLVFARYFRLCIY